MKPVLVIISGPAATGKSTLARKFSDLLQIPAFGVDLYKEQLYDSQGAPKSLEEHRVYGRTAYQLLEKNSYGLLSKQTSHIIEGSFQNRLFAPTVNEWLTKLKFQTAQIQLRCEGEVLLKRFIDREKSGKQHPGHQGLLYLDAMRDALLKGAFEKLEIPGHYFEIETTRPDEIDSQCRTISDSLKILLSP